MSTIEVSCLVIRQDHHHLSQSSILLQSLLRAFKDPSSPFHLREGEVGPASSDEPPRGFIQTQPFSTAADSFEANNENFAAAEEARSYALSKGHDPDSFYEEKVVWGDMDSFRCGNYHCSNHIFFANIR